MDSFYKKYQQTPFEVLDVSKNVSLDTLKKIYKKEVIKCHPDKINGKKSVNRVESSLNRKNDSKIFDKLKLAYTLICNHIAMTQEINEINNSPLEISGYDANDVGRSADNKEYKTYYEKLEEESRLQTYDTIGKCEYDPNPPVVPRQQLSDKDFHKFFDYHNFKNSDNQDLVKMNKLESYSQSDMNYTELMSYKGVILYEDDETLSRKNNMNYSNIKDEDDIDLNTLREFSFPEDPSLPKSYDYNCDEFTPKERKKFNISLSSEDIMELRIKQEEQDELDKERIIKDSRFKTYLKNEPEYDNLRRFLD